MDNDTEIKQNVFMYKCMVWPNDYVSYPWYIRFIAPVIQLWYYGWADVITDYIPYWILRKFHRKNKTIKIPASFCKTEEDMFHACFMLLGRFVEDELGVAPSKKKAKFEESVWGHSSSTYRGYRLHSDDQQAIDLWIWYKHERQLAIDGEQELENLAIGEIDGYRPQYFKDRPKEPDYIIKKREEYEKQLKEYRFLHYGPMLLQQPHTSSSYDDIKFIELLKIRKTLWT